MSVQRFVAANSREAFRQVRFALGDDALILANRRVEDGVEILAMPDQAVAPAENTAPAPTRESGRQVPAGQSDFVALSERLLTEMQDMRALLDRRAGRTDRDTAEKLRCQMMAAGFGQGLAAELVAGLPPELAHGGASEAECRKWLVRQLCARLPVAGADDSLLDGGGIVALLGPTGVGKTTTAAKLAAHYVMRHGNEGVALVTTDTYRIGAQDQLRIYAELLEVDMVALEEEQSPGVVLSELAARKRLVIVDTVGTSQRDERLVEEVARLCGNTSVRPVLLLNAASQAETLAEVVACYRKAARTAGIALSDAIVTKTDEAGRLGPVLATAVNAGLRLHFNCHGQRVPEDLAAMDGEGLVATALQVDAGTVAAVPRTANLENWSRQLLAGGRSLSRALATLDERVPGFSYARELWECASLPDSIRAQRLATVVDDWPRQPVATLLWRRSGRGALPHTGLDDQGRPLADTVMSHAPFGNIVDGLQWAEGVMNAQAHVLPAVPGAAAWRHLKASEQSWIARVRGGARVSHAGERHSLGSLEGRAENLESFDCRYRGQPVRVRLRHLPVVMLRTAGLGKGEGHFASAWFGELVGLNNSRVLGRRQWLLSAGLTEEAGRALVRAQLRQEELSALDQRSRRGLEDVGVTAGDSTLSVLLASSLAALAANLDHVDSDWALDLRGQLLGLLGGRRQCSGRALVDSLLRLLMARDSLRQIGDPGFAGAA